VFKGIERMLPTGSSPPLGSSQGPLLEDSVWLVESRAGDWCDGSLVGDACLLPSTMTRLNADAWLQSHRLANYACY
jgi:hypothetical protein